MWRSVQLFTRLRQMESLRTGGKGWPFGKGLRPARLRYRLGPHDIFFGVRMRCGRSCCFWACEGGGSRGSTQLSGQIVSDTL